MMPYLCLKHKMIKKKVQHKSSMALSECIIIAKQLVTAVEVKGLEVAQLCCYDVDNYWP